MPDAYLFDMDGTLIDTEVLWVEATVQFFADRGLPVEEGRCTQFVYGRAWPDVHATIIEDYPALRGMSLSEMDAAMRPHFRRLRQERDVRIPGSIELLHALAETHPIAIVSGSTRADIADGLRIMEIQDKVDFFLGSEDYSPGKPDPSCYLSAAAQVGVAPAACVVFEDSRAGVLAAKAAGMFCVALERENAQEQDVSAADLVLKDLRDFDASRLRDHA